MQVRQKVGVMEHVAQGLVHGEHIGMSVEDSVSIVPTGHPDAVIQLILVTEYTIIAYVYLHRVQTVELVQVTQVNGQLPQILDTPGYIPLGQEV